MMPNGTCGFILIQGPLALQWQEPGSLAKLFWQIDHAKNKQMRGHRACSMGELKMHLKMRFANRQV